MTDTAYEHCAKIADCMAQDSTVEERRWAAARIAELIRAQAIHHPVRSIPNAEGVEAMVEKVAQAILNSARDDGNDSPVDYGDAEGLARAALEAAQLPTLLERVERMREWALDKAETHHRLAHENEPLRTEHIASSAAYRNLADEVEALVSLNVR